MYCPECEQLFDAYLDGQLAGSLRLEFDAHRLRCQRCQQTLAMLEAAGNVIASDSQVPEMSEDFTERVMRDITQPQVRTLCFPSPRVALIAAAVVQAAAVITVAVVWQSRSIPNVAPAPLATVATRENASKPDAEAIHRLIVEGFEDRVWDMYAACTRLPADVLDTARYLDIVLPPDVARESAKMAGVNPWQSFWDLLQPGEDEEPEPAPSADEVHSI